MPAPSAPTIWPCPLHPAPTSNGSPQAKQRDPLVLDLDRDGSPLVSWDSDGSGIARITSWVNPDDGFLVRDLNRNRQVDGQGELFGNATLIALDDLALSDSNGDGVIDARDDIWGDLQVWCDLDQDGVSDAGEVTTQAQAGIVSFNTANQGGTGSQLADARAAGYGSFATNDGVSHQMAAVLFYANAYFTTHSVPTGVTITPDVLALPQLHGMGQVVDLRLAMTQDPALQASVQSLRNTGATMTGPDFRAAFQAMVWDRVDLAPSSFGTAAFSSAFLSKILQTVPGTPSGYQPADEPAVVQELINSLALRFVISIANADIAAGNPDTAFTPFALIDCDSAAGTITGFPEPVIRALMADLPGDRAAAMAYLEQTMPLLSSLQ